MSVLGLGRKPKEKVWFESNNCTYFGIVGEEKEYVFGFTIKILQTVCASSSAQGGWSCELRHINHKNKTFSCFLTTTALHKESQFIHELAVAEGLPPVMSNNVSSNLLHSFVRWKNEEFMKFCTKNKLTYDKIPLEYRNLQQDGTTYAFAPDLFFELKESVERINPNGSSYTWISSKLRNVIPLKIAETTTGANILEVIRQKLEADGMEGRFPGFLLVNGHTNVLSLHYREILKIFNLCPNLLMYGPRATGKSFFAEAAVSFLGTNATDICVSKELTLAAVKDRCTGDPFPLIMHDCPDEVVAACLHSCYEGKTLQKHESHRMPVCSVTVTCNEKQMYFLQQRYELLSRTAVLPMLTQIKCKSKQEQEEIQRGMKEASFHFPKLLNFSTADKENLRARAYELRLPISEVLSTRVTDSKHRISENYAIVIAATELFLEKVGLVGWKAKLLPFVMQEILPEAIPFYVYRECGKAVQVRAGGLGSERENLLNEFCQNVLKIRNGYPEELSKCFRFMPVGDYVCIRQNEFNALAWMVTPTSAAIDGLLRACNAVPLQPQKFPSGNGSVTSHRCYGIPKTVFEENQLDVLSGWAAELSGLNDSTSKKAPLSPFKSQSSTSSVFVPLATSTQNACPSLIPLSASVSPVRESPEVPVRRSREPPDANKAQDVGRPEQQESNSQSGHIRVAADPVASTSFTTEETPVIPPKAAPKNTKKRPLAADIACHACGKRSGEEDTGNTVICSVCRKRFHIACQTFDSKLWPSKQNARQRKCEGCRKNV
ncbi:uncharacterized protein LOC129582917 [Paramacrobiotus metropolitanus]|uniref:uncharacterized protein LOC129582917 n=1 Tax=Paramacrobiotus metropolitanus TaxID=2943436 RepID=UPI0024462D0B|nr:uncharacterized protein LOC129582917 [Paramacrobiotus metropolitanus]